MSPVATIVVTTHNRPELVRRAVRSALDQTLADIEVIVVDDGSAPPFDPETDDERLRIIRRALPEGMCAARNAGLWAARGAWITFLDDDDELLPSMLERSIAAAEGSSLPSPVAVMSTMAVVAPDGSEVDRCRPPTLRRGEHYLLERRGDLRAKNTLVMPTPVVRTIGGFDPQLDAFEADDFGIRLNRVASILGFDDVLYRMQQHPEPRLTRRARSIPRDMERTLEKHRDVFRRHRAARAHFMGTIGVYDLKIGNWSGAIRWCARAVVTDPRQRRLWVFAAAAIGGPPMLAGARRLRRSRLASLLSLTLTKQRVRKYSRRLANYPRAMVASPIAQLTSARIRRTADVEEGTPGRVVLLLSIYRQRNGPIVAPLVDEAVTRGWTVRLWALDRVDAPLSSWTVGIGPGTKFPLLNRLVRSEHLDDFDWVVVVDDDFVLRHGSLDTLLGVAERAGLDLVQPAHSELSHRDHELAVRRPLAVARRTSFVEIGPVFAVRTPWITRVFPFPSEHEMGWGLELEWFELGRRGARLGVVDAITIRHLHPVGGDYGKREERTRLQDLVRQHGLESFDDIQQTIATWRPWQAEAPWIGTASAAREKASRRDRTTF